jgi:hypothetical protein
MTDYIFFVTKGVIRSCKTFENGARSIVALQVRCRPAAVASSAQRTSDPDGRLIIDAHQRALLRCPLYP